MRTFGGTPVVHEQTRPDFMEVVIACQSGMFTQLLNCLQYLRRSIDCRFHFDNSSNRIWSNDEEIAIAEQSWCVRVYD